MYGGTLGPPCIGCGFSAGASPEAKPATRRRRALRTNAAPKEARKGLWILKPRTGAGRRSDQGRFFYGFLSTKENYKRNYCSARIFWGVHIPLAGRLYPNGRTSISHSNVFLGSPYPKTGRAYPTRKSRGACISQSRACISQSAPWKVEGEL